MCNCRMTDTRSGPPTTRVPNLPRVTPWAICFHAQPTPHLGPTSPQPLVDPTSRRYFRRDPIHPTSHRAAFHTTHHRPSCAHDHLHRWDLGSVHRLETSFHPGYPRHRTVFRGIRCNATYAGEDEGEGEGGRLGAGSGTGLGSCLVAKGVDPVPVREFGRSDELGIDLSSGCELPCR